MLTTITVGSRVWIQGTFVRECGDGTVLIRVGKRLFRGMPVVRESATIRSVPGVADGAARPGMRRSSVRPQPHAGINPP